MLGALVSWLRDAAAWLDMGMTTAPLTMGEALTGQEWAKVGVSTAVWVGLPLAIGVWRSKWRREPDIWSSECSARSSRQSRRQVSVGGM